MRRFGGCTTCWQIRATGCWCIGEPCSERSSVDCPSDRRVPKGWAGCSAAGASRSASFVVGYLMWRDKATYEDVVARVRKIRPVVSPNPGFVEQLLWLEESLLSPLAKQGKLAEALHARAKAEAKRDAPAAAASTASASTSASAGSAVVTAGGASSGGESKAAVPASGAGGDVAIGSSRSDGVSSDVAAVPSAASSASSESTRTDAAGAGVGVES